MRKEQKTPVERVRAALRSANAIPSSPKVSKVLRLLGPALDVVEAADCFGPQDEPSCSADRPGHLWCEACVTRAAFGAAVAKEFPDA